MSHVTMGNNSFRCLHCGDEHKFEPTSINMLIGMMRGYEKDHAHCKPSERGAAKMNAKNAVAWRNGFDTGTSSLTIWHVFMGGSSGRVDIPYDPADFGRCFRLLALAPEWRAELHKVSKAHRFWKPFVDAWPELEALWNEETQRPDGCAPKLFARMQQLVKESHAIRYAEEANR